MGRTLVLPIHRCGRCGGQTVLMSAAMKEGSSYPRYHHQGCAACLNRYLTFYIMLRWVSGRKSVEGRCRCTSTDAFHVRYSDLIGKIFSHILSHTGHVVHLWFLCVTPSLIKQIPRQLHHLGTHSSVHRIEKSRSIGCLPEYARITLLFCFYDVRQTERKANA